MFLIYQEQIITRIYEKICKEVCGETCNGYLNFNTIEEYLTKKK